jgi:hypothetical protein
MRVAAGFVLGVATAATVATIAVLTGRVDEAVNQHRKDRRRAIEVRHRVHSHKPRHHNL